MKRVVTLLFATAVAAAGFAWNAQAMPTDIPGVPAAGPAVTEVGFVCGPGYHLGPEGRYCWPNGVAAVPHGWAQPCPPGYHLGPEGRHCWRN